METLAFLSAILVAILCLAVAVALTVLEFKLLRGACKYCAKVLVDGFASNLDEEDRTRRKFWVSIVIFLTIVLGTWKTITLVMIGNVMLPATVLQVFLR